MLQKKREEERDRGEKKKPALFPACHGQPEEKKKKKEKNPLKRERGGRV